MKSYFFYSKVEKIGIIYTFLMRINKNWLAAERLICKGLWLIRKGLKAQDVLRYGTARPSDATEA